MSNIKFARTISIALLLCIIATTAFAGNVQALPSNAVVDYAVGTDPLSVTAGDFNRDGNPDLAVANRVSNNVSILTGNGDGTFNAAVNYAVGTNPRSVTEGDFNRDGNLDLAVANAGSNNVSVLLNIQVVVRPRPRASVNTMDCLQVDILGKRINTNISGSKKIQSTIDIISADGMLHIYIPKGTVIKNADGSIQTMLNVKPTKNPPPPPEGVHFISLAYDFVPSGTTFEPPITLTFNYNHADIPEGVAEEDLVVAYYDKDAGEWVECECTRDPKTNLITASIRHFTSFAVIGEAIPPAAFSLSNLVIQPVEVKPGETVTVTVAVANTGGTEGTHNLVLKVNGVKEESKDIEVMAGGVESVSFTINKQQSGTHIVAVNGLTCSYTATAPTPKSAPAPPPPPAEVKPTPPPPTAPPPAVTTLPPPAPAPPATNWWLIGGIIAGVIVISAIAWRLKIFLRRG